ncbi:MAG: hypothetical protein IPI02_23055 [Sterolibacteriaceae bacterium]|nr:hypothetical protein [Sterolibacteriaceae bacterium]
MMAELALAAVALPLWLTLSDGLLRDAAFVTLFIAGVSTLLFNANPLQRLDGYYIATDAPDCFNLAPRSRQWWQDVLRRRLLRVPSAEPMVAAPGEAAWLAAYAPLAWLNSLVSPYWQWPGWDSYRFARPRRRRAARLADGLQPMILVARSVAPCRDAAPGHGAQMASAVAAGGVLLVVVPLSPVPQRTRVQGVVWPPEQSQLARRRRRLCHRTAGRRRQPGVAREVVLQLANPAL